MGILKQIFNSTATNFLCLLILKTMIIFFQIFKNFEFKRPYTYTRYQLLLECAITMILVYADKAKKPNWVLVWMVAALFETIFLTGYSFMVNLHDLYHPIYPEASERMSCKQWVIFFQKPNTLSICT